MYVCGHRDLSATSHLSGRLCNLRLQGPARSPPPARVHYDRFPSRASVKLMCGGWDSNPRTPKGRDTPSEARPDLESGKACPAHLAKLCYPRIQGTPSQVQKGFGLGRRLRHSRNFLTWESFNEPTSVIQRSTWSLLPRQATFSGTLL